jgi:raffinose/stachyose/melibiose transport system permease protein
VHRNLKAYFFLIPSLLLVLVFNYVPILQALFRSLYDWRGGSLSTFVGLRNFVELFGDRAFGVSLANQLALLVFHIVIILTVPLATAEMIFGLRTLPRLQHVYRVLFVVPMVVPSMVVLLIWAFIYDGEVGLLNALLRGFGLDRWSRGWLADPDTALYAIMGVGFPWVGGTAVLIYLAGLLGVNGEIWDAAKLDGVSGFRRFAHIDLPLIVGQIKLMLVLTVINQTQGFVGVLVLTQGGPGWSTLVPGLYLYQNAFMHARMGYANAVGVVLFAFLMVVTLVQMKFIRSDSAR